MSNTCVKCSRPLNARTDHGHRWCKHCRSLEYLKLSNAPPDTVRAMRGGYEYTAMAMLLNCLASGQVLVIQRSHRKYFRFDVSTTQKRQRKRLLKKIPPDLVILRIDV